MKFRTLNPDALLDDGMAKHDQIESSVPHLRNETLPAVSVLCWAGHYVSLTFKLRLSMKTGGRQVIAQATPLCTISRTYASSFLHRTSKRGSLTALTRRTSQHLPLRRTIITLTPFLILLSMILTRHDIGNLLCLPASSNLLNTVTSWIIHCNGPQKWAFIKHAPASNLPIPKV
eukprot:TRINITY_DN2836_c0_g1_i1.p1 TRINITY_DN2836_c0_g1~~TRINITY_DN2836_c0_g1_i1.p1  ORF type:complete len:174 (+),score=0.93 TRINITY_DN2836_c0_g1_i1:195-716(+)